MSHASESPEPDTASSRHGSESTVDPSITDSLAVARAGHTYFGELLSTLDDAAFAEPSLLPGWSRAHVIAHMAYNARGLTRLMEWALTGVETPMYRSMEERDRELEAGAALPPAELRELWSTGVTMLDDAWRRADDETWHAEVRTARGVPIEALATIWMRTREIWVHAIDLNAGGTFADLPPQVARRVLEEVTSGWHEHGADAGLRVRIEGDPTGAVEYGDLAAADATVISGPLAAVTAWATGRSLDGVTSSTGIVEPAPRWM